MFAEILTVVPLMLPPILATGVNDQPYAQAPSPSVARTVAPISPTQLLPAVATLALPPSVPVRDRSSAADFSRYGSAPSLQRLVFALPGRADPAAHLPKTTRVVQSGGPQLPVEGHILTDVTADLAWRRETADRLRGIFE